jgi:hypothetical protein
MSHQKDEKKRAQVPNFSPDEKVALLNLIKNILTLLRTRKQSQ